MKYGKFYTELKHRETMNSVDMLKGCINRMCVTDDFDELRRMLTSAMCSLSDLYSVNRKKLFERSELDYDDDKEILL